MARGKYYTEQENTVLKALCEDNEGKSYIDYARLAQRYNICADRNVDALACHISDILNANEDEDGNAEDIQKDADVLLLIAEKERDEFKRKYEEACKAVIGSAELYENSDHALKLDYRSIFAWILREEPERANARIKELRLLREKTDGKKA